MIYENCSEAIVVWGKGGDETARDVERFGMMLRVPIATTTGYLSNSFNV